MIHIGLDPIIAEVGPFTMSWHGFFAFVAVALAVFLVGRWARRDGLDPDIVYSTAVWAIIGGIIGTRLLHVIDRWDYYSAYPGQIPAIWSGGLTIWGAILGGTLAGVIGAKIMKYPIGRLMDLTAPALLLAQAIGRIGDIINGEHFSDTTSMPWGFLYTHPDSPSFGLAAQHPAVAYELIYDLAIFGIIWSLRGRLQPNGMLFALYLALYAFGRFFISFLRLDKEWVAGLNEAQIICIIVLVVTVPLLAYRAKFVSKEVTPAPAPSRPRARR